MVTIRQTALPRLWAVCCERGYEVVADVHAHPQGCGQSSSDMANPVMPRAGHIAMILPNFTQDQPEPERHRHLRDPWALAGGRGHRQRVHAT